MLRPNKYSRFERGLCSTLALAVATFLQIGVAFAQEKKELVFATDPTYPPFEFSQDGKLVGFDIDLMAAVSEAAGFEAKFEGLAFDAIIPALMAGSYDGAIAAMVATPERAQSITFSQPVLQDRACDHCPIKTKHNHSRKRP